MQDPKFLVGVVAPADTCAANVDRVNAKIVASTPQKFGALIKSDIAKRGKLVKEAGIKAE